MAVYIHVYKDLLEILIRCMMMHVFIFIHIYYITLCCDALPGCQWQVKV